MPLDILATMSSPQALYFPTLNAIATNPGPNVDLERSRRKDSSPVNLVEHETQRINVRARNGFIVALCLFGKQFRSSVGHSQHSCIRLAARLLDSNADLPSSIKANVLRKQNPFF